jgi:alkylation response protein AidB-like acyl-CoA dehydrogenase
MESLTPTERRDLLDRIDRLAADRFAPRAAAYDREARCPVENYEDLWKEGFLALNVPRAHGGLEVDPLTYFSVIEHIARACASTAMTLHMHSCATKFVALLGTPEQQARYFAEVVEGGKLLASWASETQISLTRTFLVSTPLRPVDGGYVLNGDKHFCTMAGVASYYLVWCMLEGAADMATGAMLAAVPADNPGVSILGEWDTLGMRATVSPGARFAECFVRDDEILGPPGGVIASGVLDMLGLGYAAVYLGIAQGALDFTLDYCRTTTFKPQVTPIGHDPLIQRQCGEMAITLDSARLVVYRSAADFASVEQSQRSPLVARAKYAATQAAIAVTTACLQVCGGRSAFKTLPVERAFRDVRTATLMPPNIDTMLGAIGRDALGLSGAAFKFG